MTPSQSPASVRAYCISLICSYQTRGVSTARLGHCIGTKLQQHLAHGNLAQRCCPVEQRPSPVVGRGTLLAVALQKLCDNALVPLLAGQENRCLPKPVLLKRIGSET